MECADSGFTFAEFLIALALVLLLSAVAARTVLEAGKAAIRAKDGAEWIATVTLFDRTLRTAFSAWPPAFWGREPDIEKSATGYRIIDRSEATEFAVEFSIGRAGTGKLAVLWGGRCTVIGSVDSISVVPCKRSGIDPCAVIVLLVSGRNEQQFVATFGGARL
ncbi:MAG TPA: prepilin-type N-terminal cleavage/methylation domain-containing protein [Spirochaetia bacterium]|nr:prepilin-type N-terminal cleavage/methylation domain-containing protein [Spirochaetia bacterium]